MTLTWLDDSQPPAVSTDVDTALVRVDTFRSSGAGGQHRNKTDSGVRLTHLPTGLVVTATEERSQHQNRQVAWGRLHEALNSDAAAAAHTAVNQERQESLTPGRDWTWCGWRDEVSTPQGRKASMKRALAGDLTRLLAR